MSAISYCRVHMYKLTYITPRAHSPITTQTRGACTSLACSFTELASIERMLASHVPINNSCQLSLDKYATHCQHYFTRQWYYCVQTRTDEKTPLPAGGLGLSMCSSMPHLPHSSCSRISNPSPCWADGAVTQVR
jgi:hypothetical protein